jgi:hypothetical protein
LLLLELAGVSASTGKRAEVEQKKIRAKKKEEGEEQKGMLLLQVALADMAGRPILEHAVHARKSRINALPMSITR